MAGRNPSVSPSEFPILAMPGADELIARLERAEAGREEALLECGELRDRLHFTTAERNRLDYLLKATAHQLARAERAVEDLHRQRSRDQDAILMLEARLAASQTEAANAEEGFRIALDDLEISSCSLAESNLQLYDLTRTLERQVDERTADLKASLADRDALIEEIHHQTRNNLQIIASLLNLQANRVSGQSAAEVRKSLGRIQAMSLVHGLVFDQGSRADTLALPLLSQLCRQLAAKTAETSRIAVNVSGHMGRIPLNAAAPLGLIVAELVGNALSHAFPATANGGLENGRVEIAALGNPATSQIVIHDNGIGMDPAAANERRGLGLLLVKTLARQVNAEVRFLRDGGTRVKIHLRGARSTG